MPTHDKPRPSDPKSREALKRLLPDRIAEGFFKSPSGYGLQPGKHKEAKGFWEREVIAIIKLLCERGCSLDDVLRYVAERPGSDARHHSFDTLRAIASRYPELNKYRRGRGQPRKGDTRPVPKIVYEEWFRECTALAPTEPAKAD